MFTVVKVLIGIKMLSFKIRAYERWKKKIDKRFVKICEKSKWLDSEIVKDKLKRSYSYQNIHPEDIWEQRGEREELKAKL